MTSGGEFIISPSLGSEARSSTIATFSTPADSSVSPGAALWIKIVTSVSGKDI
jgi:hypothetical protein